jgi:cell division protein FtsZ
MVFITAGLGGGTGTGAAPIVASLAKELNALTVAVVTKPFQFEGTRRRKIAERGLAELASTVDTVISIPNERLLDITGEDTSFVDAFRQADDVLLQAVQGISDIIVTPGLINRDFADIRAVMAGMGHAILSTAEATGPRAVVDAARQAITCPLLDDGGVSGARGLLINITGPISLRMKDINEACKMVAEATGNDEVHLSFGVVVSDSPKDDVKVTVIATGFDRELAPAEPVVVPRARAAAAATTAEPPLPTRLAEFVAAPEPSVESRATPPVEMAAADEAQQSSVPARAVPEPRPGPAGECSDAENDLDIPAFMRRERRLV